MVTPDLADDRIAEGIRLFNSGQFFECHDVLEDYWSELTGPEKPFFQGLIQAAVALFHYEEGNLGGALRMYRSSRVYLSPFGPETAGINVSLLLTELDRCFDQLSDYQNRNSEELALDPALIPKIRYSE